MLKLFGAILIISGCGTFGFWIAARHRKEEYVLRQFIGLLDYMECELQYRLTPLPELFRQAAVEATGNLRDVFLAIAQELEAQISPDVERCVCAALSKSKELPKTTHEGLLLLGRTSGRFELSGLFKALDSVRTECRLSLERLSYNKDTRLRCYQTLGFCAGAAIAILFI